MARTDDAEVTAVKRRHFGGVEPLRRGDHRGVDGAERQVPVLGDEPGDADRVAGVQRKVTGLGQVIANAPFACSAGSSPTRRHKFNKTDAPTRYVMRAQVPDQGGNPHLEGDSDPLTLIVLPHRLTGAEPG